jgi:hypothetical protein
MPAPAVRGADASAPAGAPAEPLGPEGVELLRFRMEAGAARRLRGTRGFRATLRSLSLDEQLRPPRQALVAGAMRLWPGHAPRALVGALEGVSRALGLEGRVEVYQAPGPPGAWVVPDGNTALVALGGALLSMLDHDELAGMLGHALGGYALHGAPGAPGRGEVRVAACWQQRAPSGDQEPERLRAAALLVATEISADRIGLLCAGGLEAYVSAWLKRGTEVSERVLRHDPAAYLLQVREALAESTGARRRGGSHPERHVRVRAAELFAESDLYRALSGQGPGRRPIAEVDAEIGRLLAGWVPRGASTIEQARFEQFLLAAGAAIASADGEFCRQEREFLELTLPLAFRGRLPCPAEADRVLDGFAAEIKRGGDQRARVSTLNFLCGLVDADGRAKECELAAIDEVGRALGARGMFRRELARRYGFDPRAYTPGQAGRPRVPRREVPPPLLRYLKTVEISGERALPLRKLLRLAGAARRSPRALERLGAVLLARGISVSEDLAAMPLDAPVVLRVRARSPAKRAARPVAR